MELGKKLKQARLEAGLSQRQLCGDTITRNMLSQIENGSAKPSLATLRVLCARLGKPVTYFWADAPSENVQLLKKAETLPPREALALLADYQQPDPALDPAYHRLCTRLNLILAQQALEENRPEYARSLLEKVREHGYIQEFAREAAVLAYQAEDGQAISLAEMLPDNTWEMCLRGEAALRRGDPEKCLACLLVADQQTTAVCLLRGEAYLQMKQYPQAAECFHSLELQCPKIVYPYLERCYREMENYQKAYEYACKQR